MYVIINSDNQYLSRRFDYPARFTSYYVDVVIIFPSFKRAKQYCYNTGIDMRYHKIVEIKFDIVKEYDLTNEDVRDWSYHLGKFLKD